MTTTCDTSSPIGTIYRSETAGRGSTARLRAIGKRMRSRTGVIATVSTIAVVATASVAAAHVTASAPTTGSGSGAVHGTVTMTLDTVVGTETPAGGAGPGGFGPGGTIAIDVAVQNTNTRVLSVQQLIPTGTIKVTNASSGHSGCAAASVTASPVTVNPGDPGSAIPPGATERIPVFITMDANADAECQGAAFSIPIKVLGRVL